MKTFWWDEGGWAKAGGTRTGGMKPGEMKNGGMKSGGMKAGGTKASGTKTGGMKAGGTKVGGTKAGGPHTLWAGGSRPGWCHWWPFGAPPGAPRCPGAGPRSARRWCRASAPCRPSRAAGTAPPRRRSPAALSLWGEKETQNVPLHRFF